MKKLFLISMFLTSIGLSQSYARYFLISIGNGCYEVWDDDPCNGGAYIGTGCTGIVAGNPNTSQEFARLITSKGKTIVVPASSDLAKLIRKVDPQVNLKSVKVGAVKTEAKKVPANGSSGG